MMIKAVVEAIAAGTESGKGAAPVSPWITFMPFFVIIGGMFILSNHSQKKQRKAQQDMLNSLTTGARVQLASGMRGMIVQVKDDTLVVEIADGVKVEFERIAVISVIKDKNAAVKVEKAD